MNVVKILTFNACKKYLDNQFFNFIEIFIFKHTNKMNLYNYVSNHRFKNLKLY